MGYSRSIFLNATFAPTVQKGESTVLEWWSKKSEYLADSFSTPILQNMEQFQTEARASVLQPQPRTLALLWTTLRTGNRITITKFNRLRHCVKMRDTVAVSLLFRLLPNARRHCALPTQKPPEEIIVCYLHVYSEYENRKKAVPRCW